MKQVSILLTIALTLIIPITAETTVGIDGEFKTIREALLCDQPDPLILVLIDPVYTEPGLVIDREVTIIGSGRALTIVQGAEERGEAPDRVFRITKEGKAIFKAFTIRHGIPGEMPFRGGGIDNEGFVKLENCTISSNDAYYGGGIFTRGRVEMVGCALFENKTLRSPLVIRTSGLGCNGAGGAIKTEKGGDILLENCSLYNNYSVSRGGALFVACESRAVLRNTTVANNEAKERAGGIYVRGDLYLTHTTIAHNTSFQRGGGLANTGRVSMQSCLIADNTLQDYLSIDGYGFYGNALETENVGNFVADGSLEGADSGDAKLKEMEFYEDDMAIVPISWNSEARNRQSYYFTPYKDQSSIKRDKKPDSGAFEWQLFRK